MRHQTHFRNMSHFREFQN